MWSNSMPIPAVRPAWRPRRWTGTSRQRSVVRVRRFRRNSSQPPAAAGAETKESNLSGLAPISVDYDEARSSEERSTYHLPRPVAQGEFVLDVHPLRRAKSLLGRAKRTR
jgi:hypothetical protein